LIILNQLIPKSDKKKLYIPVLLFAGGLAEAYSAQLVWLDILAMRILFQSDVFIEEIPETTNVIQQVPDNVSSVTSLINAKISHNLGISQ